MESEYTEAAAGEPMKLELIELYICKRPASEFDVIA
jgi:hypothetical protein